MSVLRNYNRVSSGHRTKTKTKNSEKRDETKLVKDIDIDIKEIEVWVTRKEDKTLRVGHIKSKVHNLKIEIFEANTGKYTN